MPREPQQILDTIADLVLSQGDFPSLAEIARACGLSKPGVLHHFPSRSAMAEALVAREVGRVDELLEKAAAEGHAVDTWLELSSPNGRERALYIAMSSTLAEGTAGLSDLLAEATTRWDAVLERELADPDLALLVRLVGDGLLANALAGTPVPPIRLKSALARAMKP